MYMCSFFFPKKNKLSFGDMRDQKSKSFILKLKFQKMCVCDASYIRSKKFLSNVFQIKAAFALESEI